MQITIKTLVMVHENREVTLTRAIVNQLPWFLPTKYKRTECLKVGNVELPNYIFYLVSTPEGLQRTKQDYTALEGVNDRIILLK